MRNEEKKMIAEPLRRKDIEGFLPEIQMSLFIVPFFFL